MNLHDKIARLRIISDLAEADVESALAEREEAEGHPLGAEWHRAEAERLRTGGNREKAHAAWLRHMADLHLRNGTVPDGCDRSAAEIETLMDEMRDAALTEDRVSHSTEIPGPVASGDPLAG